MHVAENRRAEVEDALVEGLTLRPVDGHCKGNASRFARSVEPKPKFSVSVGGIGAIGVFCGFGGSAVPAGLGSSGRFASCAAVAGKQIGGSAGTGRDGIPGFKVFQKIENFKNLKI